MVIIGLDLSLTRSGISIHDGAQHLKTYSIETSEKLILQERIGIVVDDIWPKITRTSWTFIEKHIYGKFGKSYDRAELAGVIKYALWKNFRKYVLVPPGTLKIWVTGKGTGEKPLMLHRVAAKMGYEAENDDQSDAYALADFGYHLLHAQPKRTLVDYELKALKKFRKEHPQFQLIEKT